MQLESFRSTNYNYEFCVHEPKIFKDNTCDIELCERCYRSPVHKKCDKQCKINKVDFLMQQYLRAYDELKLIHDDLELNFFDLEKEFKRYFRPLLQQIRAIKRDYVGDLVFIDKKWTPKMK
jgi:hypothetical protein